ncbi:MAG: hypothetical protein ACTHJ3_19465 [Pararhizobium sp.]
MRLAAASLALVALLGTSLAGKAIATMPRAPAAADNAAAVVALLRARGLAVTLPDHRSAPYWITGTRGACRVRIVDVPPEGWARRIVAEQTRGEALSFAFDGRFYPQQPVARTRLENYRRRLFGYLGLPAAPLHVRAVTLSPGCPADTIGPEDALALSR